ncbi:MAG: hypothetical protein JNN03_11410 [Rubrivivax sp.]|nr:hypothetical protein [Rubrivivax sp.]
MNATLGWGLALLAFVAGYVGYGWRGVFLALTVVVFWLLLQFSRSLRVLRDASRRPVGSIDSAVMLHAKLHEGMRLPQILKLTKSLGHKVGEEPNEAFAWTDPGGDSVQVQLREGRLASWALQRADGPATPGPTPPGT